MIFRGRRRLLWQFRLTSPADIGLTACFLSRSCFLSLEVQQWSRLPWRLQEDREEEEELCPPEEQGGWSGLWSWVWATPGIQTDCTQTVKGANLKRHLRLRGNSPAGGLRESVIGKRNSVLQVSWRPSGRPGRRGLPHRLLWETRPRHQHPGDGQEPGGEGRAGRRSFFFRFCLLTGFMNDPHDSFKSGRLPLYTRISELMKVNKKLTRWKLSQDIWGIINIDYSFILHLIKIKSWAGYKNTKFSPCASCSGPNSVVGTWPSGPWSRSPWTSSSCTCRATPSPSSPSWWCAWWPGGPSKRSCPCLPVSIQRLALVGSDLISRHVSHPFVLVSFSLQAVGEL